VNSIACQTCDIIRGLLLARGIPTPLVDLAIESVARDEEVMKAQGRVIIKKTKRKATAYARRYGRAFKKVASKYKTKSGAWMKNGFARAQKEAHRIAKRG